MRAWLHVGVILGLAGCQVLSGLSELEIDEGAGVDADSTGSEPSDASAGPTDAKEQPCAPPEGVECTPGNNCGCDGEETCVLSESSGGAELLCVNPGTKSSGDVCQTPEQCGAGLLCLNQVCVQACRGDSDCDQQGASCEVYSSPNGEPVPDARYCRAVCDVRAPTEPRSGFVACEPGQTCASTLGGSLCVQSDGAGRQAEPCSGAEQCAAGFACSEGTCKQWCDTEGAPCSSDDAQCVTLGDLSEAALEEPGIRQLAEAERELGLCEQPCIVPDIADSTCGILPNCGCEPPHTCRVVNISGRTACSPIGEVSAQGACGSDADCLAAHACVSGLCRPYCPPDATMCWDDSICLPVLDGEQPVHGASACLGHCDPVTPLQDDDSFTPCGEGAYCAAGVDGTELEFAYCSTAGPIEDRVAQGEYCEELAQCGNGLLCAGRCMPFCRTENDCQGLTVAPACYVELEQGSVLQAAPGDRVGVCCTPTPTAGSTCSTLETTCGCPPGQACHVADVETGRTECFDEGDAGAQAACEYSEDCQKGLSCIGGLCRPLCEGERCAPPHGRCFEAVYETVPGSEEFEPVPFSRACTGHCDPVNIERADEDFAPCGAGARCVPGHEGEPGFDESYCAVATADAQEGQACEIDQDCVEGYGCIDDTCRAWCRSDEDCEFGACDTDYDPRQVASDDWVGYCDPTLLPLDPLDP